MLVEEYFKQLNNYLMIDGTQISEFKFNSDLALENISSKSKFLNFLKLTLTEYQIVDILDKKIKNQFLVNKLDEIKTQISQKKDELNKLEAQLKTKKSDLQLLQSQLEFTKSINQIKEFINKFADFPFVPFPQELKDFTNDTGKIGTDVDENIKNFVIRYYTFMPSYDYHHTNYDAKWLLKEQDSNNRFSLDKMQDPKYSQYIADILTAKKKLEEPVAEEPVAEAPKTDGGFTRLFNSNNNRSNKKIKSKKKKKSQKIIKL